MSDLKNAWQNYAPRWQAPTSTTEMFLDYPPDGFVYIPELWSFGLTAPRARWTVPATIPKQRIFIAVLRAPGLFDFEVPVSTITIRLRDIAGSYIGCTIPDPTRYTTEILERIPGRIHILAGELAGGGRQTEELIYGNIQNIYFNHGGSNTLVVAATRFITHRNPVISNISGVSRISHDESGKYKLRCATDFFLRPTDTAVYGDAPFTVSMISHTITGADAYMDVEGA
jgi:hypothetical protein